MSTAGFVFDDDPADQFDDDDGSVHEKPINQLAAAGVVRGSGTRTYAPSQTLTRGQMAALLNRALQAMRHGAAAAHEHFTDDDDSGFEADIDLLASLGVVEGTGEQLYSPTRSVTRAAMAAFLARTADHLAAQGSWPTAAAQAANCFTFRDDGRGAIEGDAGRPTHNVLGAAIGANDRDLTVVIHLRALPASPPAPEDAFIDYNFALTVGERRLFLTAPADTAIRPSYGVLLAGRRIVLGHPRVERGAGSGAGQIRITAPLDGFAPLANPGAGDLATVMTAQTILTAATAGTPSQTAMPVIVLDLAEGRETSYRFGAPSCALDGR